MTFRKMKMAFLLSAGVVYLAGCKSRPMSNANLPNIAVLDLQNRTVNPFGEQGTKASIFFFVRTDCPISNRYAPEIERLAQRYANGGMTFWLVYPESSTTVEEIEQHRKEYHLGLLALRDPRHALVKMARVKVTPEAAVFLPN